VNGKGEIGFKDGDLHDIQRELLENEGIHFNINKRLDLQEFAHESSQQI
jgi:methylated-DNA-protein-cysteine methyltransferase-like protein